MDNLKKRLSRKGHGHAYRQAGFTLVELLVVIAIIAILSVTAYVALGGQTAKARNSRRLSDISTIQSALEIYFITNDNNYPANLTDLKPKQINKIPADPIKDKPYVYVRAGSKKTFQLSAHLEDEDGGLLNTAVVIGNGTNLIKNAFGYSSGDGSCSAGSCTVTDGSANCVPYCFQ